MRNTVNHYKDGRLYNGYDYTNQAWVKDGKYVRCGHPDDMDCDCYGRLHEGEETKAGMNKVTMNLYQYQLLDQYDHIVDKISEEYFRDSNFAFHINELNLDMDTDKVKELLKTQVEYFLGWRNANENLSDSKQSYTNVL